jgi:hypothetical protein
MSTPLICFDFGWLRSQSDVSTRHHTSTWGYDLVTPRFLLLCLTVVTLLWTIQTRSQTSQVATAPPQDLLNLQGIEHPSKEHEP